LVHQGQQLLHLRLFLCNLSWAFEVAAFALRR
jgi:hypothetical protein